MHIFILLAAAAIGSHAVAAPAASAKLVSPSKTCPKTAHYQAFDRSKAVTPKKLNELPPANAYSAVYRLVSGCEIPVLIRYNVGGR